MKSSKYIYMRLVDARMNRRVDGWLDEWRNESMDGCKFSFV